MKFVTLNGRRINTAAIVELRGAVNPQYFMDLTFFMYSYDTKDAPSPDQYPDGVEVVLSSGSVLFIEGVTKDEVEALINDREGG